MIFDTALDDDMLLILLSWMLVQDAVVFEELDLSLGGKILVTEKDDSTLSHEKGELIKLLCCQGRELDIFKDCTNTLSQVNALSHGKEGLLLRVCE